MWSGPDIPRLIASIQEQVIRAKSEALKPEWDERARRLWAATAARRLGHGGVATGARATGLAVSTVRLGKKELMSPSTSIAAPRRRRRPGAGRKSLTTQEQQLLQALDALVEPTTRGDPMSPLRWTCKRTRRLATELGRQGPHVSPSKVGPLLTALNYSLPGTRKTREGTSPPARNAQFAYIKAQGKDVQRRRQPVISVDTKTKALIGDFANGGREDQPHGTPERVRGHDFVDQHLGTAIPSGVSEMPPHWGGVSGGGDHDTAEFAVATVPQWWPRMGQPSYPQAQQVLMTADGGGSNGRRSRLWTVERQQVSDATGWEVRVWHLPPGTSTWHKSDQRLWCHITENWRGRPLVRQEVIVPLIAHTTTAAGLRVDAALNPTPYETGQKVSDDELAQVNLDPADCHSNDWNYVVRQEAA